MPLRQATKPSGAWSLKNGLLTAALLEGLESDKEQVLNIQRWLEHAIERTPELYGEKVPNEVKQQGKPQLPAVFDLIRSNRVSKVDR